MTKEQEALKLALEKIALEALENAESAMYLTSKGEEHMSTDMTKTWFDGTNIVTQKIPEAEIYKRPWVGLTFEERNGIWRKEIGWGDPSHNDEDLMKAIEAKLKEKNT
jgi:hypothetical protein